MVVLMVVQLLSNLLRGCLAVAENEVLPVNSGLFDGQRGLCSQRRSATAWPVSYPLSVLLVLKIEELAPVR